MNLSFFFYVDKFSALKDKYVQLYCVFFMYFIPTTVYVSNCFQPLRSKIISWLHADQLELLKSCCVSSKFLISFQVTVCSTGTNYCAHLKTRSCKIISSAKVSVRLCLPSLNGSGLHYKVISGEVTVVLYC